MDAREWLPVERHGEDASGQDLPDRQTVLEARSSWFRRRAAALGRHVRHRGIRPRRCRSTLQRAARRQSAHWRRRPVPIACPACRRYRERPLPEHWSTISYSTWFISARSSTGTTTRGERSDPTSSTCQSRMGRASRVSAHGTSWTLRTNRDRLSVSRASARRPIGVSSTSGAADRTSSRGSFPAIRVGASNSASLIAVSGRRRFSQVEKALDQHDGDAERGGHHCRDELAAEVRAACPSGEVARATEDRDPSQVRERQRGSG